jgi:hypothetical protein
VHRRLVGPPQLGVEPDDGAYRHSIVAMADGDFLTLSSEQLDSLAGKLGGRLQRDRGPDDQGVTKPVTLQLTRLGEVNDPAMGHRIGYSGRTQIHRKDFGMSFNPILDGKFVVSDEINISLEGELVEQAQE